MPILRSDLLTEARFVHAFPERDVGDADLRAALGAEAIAQARQVHGAVCVEATVASGASGAFGAFGAFGASAASAASGGSGGLGVEADGIVARPRTPRRIAAGVRVADWVPVLLADEGSGAVAAVHAGWRGVVGGVLSAGVARLLGPPEAERPTTPPARHVDHTVTTSASALIAAIGPCIGACCFEVGPDVAEAIQRACGTADVVARRAGEKAFVDLRKAVRAQLLALGVPGARIEDVPGCTKHEPTRFHSFRRDGKDSGRMLAAISPRSYG